MTFFSQIKKIEFGHEVNFSEPIHQKFQRNGKRKEMKREDVYLIFLFSLIGEFMYTYNTD